MSKFQLAQLKRRRKEWFERMREAYVVLWWVPQGYRPEVAEAIERLEHLRLHGPSPKAFTLRHAFQAPDANGPGSPFAFGDQCPAT